MTYDWAFITVIFAIGLIMCAAFLGYVRKGMIEAEVEWRLKMRNRFCVRCGYSLRGNVSGICPECGKRFRDAMT
jgi:hypothetical protein